MCTADKPRKKLGVPREERKGIYGSIYSEYYGEKDGANGEKREGGGGEEKSEAEIAGGIARVGTPFLRDLYRGGGACKVART